MYQGNGHVHQGPIAGGRPSQEYRSERRNTARLSYRMAKKAMKAGLVQNA